VLDFQVGQANFSLSQLFCVCICIITMPLYQSMTNFCITMMDNTWCGRNRPWLFWRNSSGIWVVGLSKTTTVRRIGEGNTIHFLKKFKKKIYLSFLLFQGRNGVRVIPWQLINWSVSFFYFLQPSRKSATYVINLSHLCHIFLLQI